MIRLSEQQKQLLFDYCIGLTSQEQAAEAEELISSNKEAAEIHSKLQAAFAPLASVKPESCPDDLAERTIFRLNNAARSSQLRLEQLLTAEQTQSVSGKSRFWLNIGKIAATAAVILFVVGVLFSSSSFAREKYRQHQCRMQLRRISQGIDHYSSDYEDKLPAVATSTGAPWWKVGEQGSENHSNTRHIWLLVKGNYVNPNDFVCPGRKQYRAIRRTIRFDASKAKNYCDFPDRNHIRYSLRIRCNKSKGKSVLGRRVLIADLNPLFERLPRSGANTLTLKLNEELSNLNSINHNRRGQNTLFCDGSVEFLRKRHTGILKDDIFTLQDIDVYQGFEVPSSEADAFLAP